MTSIKFNCLKLFTGLGYVVLVCLYYLNAFIRAYNLIINRITKRENMTENNNQIDLGINSFKKLIFRLYIPRDIYKVFINLHNS